MADHLQAYGEMQRCPETDAQYAYRDDGDAVAIHSADGEDHIITLRREDVAAIAGGFE